MSGFVTGVPVQNPQIRYTGVFGRMKFPAYRKKDYPKMVGELGKRKRVNSLREELDFLASNPALGKAPELHPVESERNELAAQTADLQAQVREKDEALMEALRQVSELSAQMRGMQEMMLKLQAQGQAAAPTPETSEEE